MSQRLYRHIRSNVWGMLALFVALGGVAWANAQVGARDIRNNAVRTGHIRDGEVGTGDLAAGAVTASKLANNAVGSNQVDEASLDRALLQSRITNACAAGQAIASVGENGTPSCTSNLQSRIANACPSGQAIASVGDDGTAGCTSNLQSRIASGCPAGQAIASVNENGTPACIPTGSAGATRINFSQGSCNSGAPCNATLFSAGGWTLALNCTTVASTFGQITVTVASSPGGGTANFSSVGASGGGSPYSVHNGFPGNGTLTTLGFTDTSAGEVGTLILNSPGQTISIAFHMYGVTDAGEDNSYCEFFGTATAA